MNRHTFFQRLLSSTPSEPHLLPPQGFFIESILLGDASSEEIGGIARLALEDLSPLPLEFLSWGVFTLPGSAKGLLYATTKERLRGLEAKMSDDSLYELPTFLGALPEKAFELKTVRAFISDDALSILVFEADERIPSRVVNVLIPNEEEDIDSLFELKNTQEAYWVEKGYHAEEGIYRLTGIEPTDKAGVHFITESFSEDGSISKSSVLLHEDIDRLWLADVRDEAFKLQEAQRRRLEGILTHVWKGGLGVLTVLIALEVLLSIGSLWNHFRQSKIDAQEPAVQIALQQQSLLESLRDLYSSELKPFEMLDLLNQVRPKELYFNQFSSEDYLHADVKGTGSSVDQVNEYAELVKAIPEVEAVLVSDVQTRQGKVQFNLQITFHPPVEIFDLEEPVEAAPEIIEEVTEAPEKTGEDLPIDPSIASPLAQPAVTQNDSGAKEKPLDVKQPEVMPQSTTPAP